MSRLLQAALCMVAVMGAAGCREPEGRERQGDRAYAAGNYAGALAAYDDALEQGGGPEVRAKLGLAALRSGDAGAAILAYERLAADDASRREEALEGLAAAARLAQAERDAAALARAVDAMRALAPERPVGRPVLALARAGTLGAAEFAALAPEALALAPDPEAGDSLLLAWGRALGRTGGCAEAAPVYRAVVRRTRDAALGAAARAAAVECALELARAALAAGDTARALTALGSVAGGTAGADDTLTGAAAALLDEVRAAAAPPDTVFPDE